jgi:hypothetical protein
LYILEVKAQKWTEHKQTFIQSKSLS